MVPGIAASYSMQTNALKTRIAKLSAGRERDIRDGKLEEAAKTALLLETLSQELNGENATTPSVSLDFTVSSRAGFRVGGWCLAHGVGGLEDFVVQSCWRGCGDGC